MATLTILPAILGDTTVPRRPCPRRLDKRCARADNPSLVCPRCSYGLVCATLLLACAKPNPAFDPDAGVSVGSSGDSSSGGPDTPTTTSTATFIATTDGSTSTSGTGVGPGSSTTHASTTSPGCGQLGEPCGEMSCCEGCGVCIEGQCMPGSDTCGPCGTCGADSQCTPAPPMTPCKLADDPCSGELWGLDGGTCFANAPGVGLCDLEGGCQPQACARGDELVACDLACVIDPGNCAAGSPVAQVDAAVLCAQDSPTPACKTGCVADDKDSIVENRCKAGICTSISVTECGKYKCKDEQSCHTTCDNNGDCKVGFCSEQQICQ